jgi:2-phosphosulfolactate phosphatase
VRADVAVVVDVLSFTPPLSVAVDRGIAVYPFPWASEEAPAYADARDAVLALGRRAGLEHDAVSLSPMSFAEVSGIQRVVLPSPNGSSISHALLSSGATVVAGSLRNATAVAGWLAPRLAEGATLAVVPAGERWPDGTLRPAAEDLWGAGAILHALGQRGTTGLSPEARLAAAAYAEVAPRIARELRACASGVELIERGFGSDVEIAAETDVSPVVPVLTDGAFVDALERPGR